MPLSLESAQTLAVGPFNPHIITPDWLVRHEICEDGEVEIRLLPLDQGLSLVFAGTQWQVDFRHLLVSSRQADCGELVAKVLGLLKHTPVRAVGNNFHYACGKQDWGDSPLPRLGATEHPLAPEEGEVEQTRWSSVFRTKGDVRVEVTVAREEQGVVVLFNFHREVKDAAEAVTAANQFRDDQTKSRELLLALFAQEVTS